MKQETLKEAAERLNPYVLNGTTPFKEGFKEGAKWQQERSYSEEKILNLLQDFANEDSINVINIKEWFEQFKNK